MLWVLLTLLLFVQGARSQGARYDGTAQRTVQGLIAPIPGATFTVCTAAGTGTPCTPTTTIYLDAGLTQPAPNPGVADSNGNFGFYAPAATTYKVSITATGVTGQLITVVLPIVGGGAATFTNLTASGTTTVNSIASGRTATIVASPNGLSQNGFHTVTVNTTAPCNFVTNEAINLQGAGVAGYNDNQGGWIVNSPGCNGGSSFTYQNPLGPLANSGGGTVTGSILVTNGYTTTGPVSMPFPGPVPWYDAKANGLKCDNVTDDTAAMASLVNLVDSNNNGVGGTIFFPPGSGPCLITNLDMTNRQHITFIQGNFMTPLGNAAPARQLLKITGTGPNLVNFNGAFGNNFIGIGFYFINATSGPEMEFNSASGNYFFQCTITGSGLTVGPLIGLTNSSGSNYWDHGTIQNASILVQGDNVIDIVAFKDISFFYWGTVAIQNAFSNWIFDHNQFNQISGTNGLPIMNWTAAHTADALTFTNNFINQIVSTNTYTAFTFPNLTLPNTQGKVLFENNLFLSGSNSKNNTLIQVGNNDKFIFQGNDVREWGCDSAVSCSNGVTSQVFNVGTGVTANIQGNTYATTNAAFAGAFMAGTPAAGRVEEPGTQSGTATIGTAHYGPLTIGFPSTLGFPLGGASPVRTLPLWVAGVTDATSQIVALFDSTFNPTNTTHGVCLGLTDHSSWSTALCGGDGVTGVAGDLVYYDGRQDGPSAAGTERFRLTRTTGAIAATGAVVSKGTLATPTGTGACATITTTAGGAFAGTGKCTGTTGASTLTITFATTAPNGYVCDVWDETTRANVFQQTSHTTTTCVLTVTSVTQNDVFVFKGIGF